MILVPSTLGITGDLLKETERRVQSRIWRLIAAALSLLEQKHGPSACLLIPVLGQLCVGKPQITVTDRNLIYRLQLPEPLPCILDPEDGLTLNPVICDLFMRYVLSRFAWHVARNAIGLIGMMVADKGHLPVARQAFTAEVAHPLVGSRRGMGIVARKASAPMKNSNSCSPFRVAPPVRHWHGNGDTRYPL